MQVENQNSLSVHNKEKYGKWDERGWDGAGLGALKTSEWFVEWIGEIAASFLQYMVHIWDW